MAAEWHTREDLINDLWSYSEIEQEPSHVADVPTPISIQQYNARIGANNDPSIFETPFVTEDVSLVSFGRGRGRRSVVVTPGDLVRPDTNPHTDAGVRRRLREVSGLGYSNELIEESFKAATHRISTFTNPEIKLQPVPSTSLTSSRGSTPSSMSRVQSPVSSKGSSACVTPIKSANSSLSMSRCSSSSSSRSPTPPRVKVPEPVKVAEEAPCSNPLPLSVMRSRAKRNVKDNPKRETNMNGEKKETEINGGRRETAMNGGLAVAENANRNVELNINAPEWIPNGNHVENDYWWNRHPETTNSENNSWRRRDTNSPNRYFGWNSNFNQKHSFNIASSKDFPALK